MRRVKHRAPSLEEEAEAEAEAEVIDHVTPNLQRTRTASPHLLSNRGPASVTSLALDS